MFVSLNGDKQDHAKQALMVSRRGSTNFLEGMGSQKVVSRPYSGKVGSRDLCEAL